MKRQLVETVSGTNVVVVGEIGVEFDSPDVTCIVSGKSLIAFHTVPHLSKIVATLFVSNDGQEFVFAGLVDFVGDGDGARVGLCCDEMEHIGHVNTGANQEAPENRGSNFFVIETYNLKVQAIFKYPVVIEE